ncbi:MAG: chromosome segregation protein SMC [Propionibacteriaceae bacterium]|nr:chromosome segregation protein SMC [Propionibacteriaceae bacterium]
MYLKKLTLRGFKSFASQTSMTLEPGITCIVGPNGSGKSNVVDALAWVMGEQGAKSLRGASMEDVIFAGTSNRAPLGRAEIQLTIDNSDGELPIDYAEVTISRTKFRNGSSEYAINGAQCRLLDVRELLSDSGIGREMHVVVGQGELDRVLQATPETRRGLVEEAAGVLKHRERKEKALRKLEATEANLNRLTDLVSEIRRQLKPLGRQAEVAKRASMVQADVRDAKARLLADDLSQAQGLLGAQIADEEQVRAKRRQVESDLEKARLVEDDSRAAMAATDGAYRRLQEVWFAVSGISERVRSIVTLADERVRNAEAMPLPSPNPDRDPETLLAQAERMSEGETKLRSEIASRAAALEQAGAVRAQAEAEHAEAEKAFEARVRASSDRREGLARLSGQITSVSARVESGQAAVERLKATSVSAAEAAEAAGATATQVDQGLPEAQALVQEREAADASGRLAVDHAAGEVDALRSAVQALVETRAGLTARVEALRMAQQAQNDGAAWVAAQTSLTGVRAPVASLIQVEPGYEQAVATGLGAVTDAVVVTDVASGVTAIEALRASDQGRAGLLVGADAPGGSPTTPGPGRPLMSVLTGDETVLAALAHLMGHIRVVDSLDEARSVIADHPDAVAVTRDGDWVSSWLVSGGSPASQSALHIASALNEAETRLAGLVDEVAAAQAALGQAQSRQAQAKAASDEARWAADEAKAGLARLRQRTAQVTQTHALARAEAERAGEQAARAEQDLVRDQALLVDLRERLALAEQTQEAGHPDPSARDALAEAAKKARAQEMEARLGLRTLEERVRSMAGQAESLRKTAQSEATARAEADARRARLARQSQAARTVAMAGQWLFEQAQASRRLAERDRDQIGTQRSEAESRAEAARVKVRQLSGDLEALVDSVHRDELNRTQQRMRIDALAERAMTEVGLDQETLMAQYGPDQPVPTGEPDPDTGEQALVAFNREEQLKRLRTAERDLQLLGKINPLALEEFDAMQERHGFLAGQLEDLKKTRADLLSIVEDVDARVKEVFAQAYVDVAREFSATFARLFPGGEGGLVLTEPDQWLTTGIDVEARPAGKKVKRLSLLSGGERSLVAVCFLVALFKARPSPFYILDEVEAALDDTNLGRLLDIYEELRTTSQLLVITHQKRTMEIADTLYGVTMGSDGTSTVVSQRLRED